MLIKLIPIKTPKMQQLLAVTYVTLDLKFKNCF